MISGFQGPPTVMPTPAEQRLRGFNGGWPLVTSLSRVKSLANPSLTELDP